MRVAIVTGIFPPDVGGPATHASDLAAELRRAGLRGVRSTKGGVSVSRVIVGRV